MAATGIRRELEQFQRSVTNLSDGLSASGTDWADQQYATLLTLVRGVASSSKQVILSGERACAMLDRFDRIADEDC